MRSRHRREHRQTREDEDEEDGTANARQDASGRIEAWRCAQGFAGLDARRVSPSVERVINYQTANRRGKRKNSLDLDPL